MSLAVILGSLFTCGFGCMGWLVYAAVYGPETSVQLGDRIPQAYVDRIRELRLIDPDEDIHFFYSDAIADFENGFYLFTQRSLVVYVRDRPRAQHIIPLEKIAYVGLDRDPSFHVDSNVWVETTDGRPIMFPLSSEGGKDRRFVEALLAAREKRLAELGLPPDLTSGE